MKRISPDRTVGELLIMMIAGTVCFAVLAAGAGVAVAELIRPAADTSGIVGNLTDILNTLIGVVAGFLAGRTDTQQQNQQPRHQDQP